MFKFIVIIIFLLISGWLKAIQKDEQPQRPQRPRGNLPPQPRGGNAAPADRLEAEIEAFLRKAGKHVQQPAAAPKRRQQSPAHSVDLAHADVVDADVVRVPLRETSVAEHVRQHIDSHPIGEEANRLGGEISQEVDDIESHIHGTFDHKLGSLKKTATSRPRDQSDVDDRGTDSHVWEGAKGRQLRFTEAQRKRTEDIRQMLSEPQSLQNAVILAEILQRRDF